MANAEPGLVMMACAMTIGNPFPPVKRLGGVRPTVVMFFAN